MMRSKKKSSKGGNDKAIEDVSEPFKRCKRV